MDNDLANKPTIDENAMTDIDSNLAPPIPGIDAGMRIGNFVLKRKLGMGGMGEVWLARQESMERDVALKLLSPVFVQDDNFIKRFLKEARIYGKLEHPNIVQAHDAGEENGIYYLAMSFVDGEDLSQICQRDIFIPEKEALRIAKKIAEALAYAWDEHKILHRDIKPSNIMVDKNGTPKLMDMGISKTLSEESSMTMTGSIVGTPYYISPEQARAEKDMDFRADIYSLGATLFHVATGNLPFKAATTMGVLSKLITESIPPPKVMNPELSDGCAMLMEVMMAKDKNERQASWQEVIEDIDNVLDGDFPATPLPAKAEERYKSVQRRTNMVEPKEASSKMLIYAVAAVVVLLVVAVGFSVVLISAKKENKGVTTHKSTTKAETVKTLSERKPQQISSPDNSTRSVDNSSKTSDKAVEAAPVHQKGTSDKRPVEIASVPTPPPPKRTPTLEEKAKDVWAFAMKKAQVAMRDHKDYDLAIANFDKIKRNFAGTSFEMRADEEIHKLKKAKSNAIDGVLAQLGGNADKFILQKQFDKAAEVYTGYSSSFANETSSQRINLAERCLRAQRDFGNLTHAVANDYFQTRCESPLSPERKFMLKDLERYFPAEIAQLMITVKNLETVEDCLEASYSKEIGKEITIPLIDGKNARIKIKRVTGKRIFGDVDGKEANIPFEKIAVAEKLKRLDSFDDAAKRIYGGTQALNSKDYDTAERYFAASGPLSDYFTEKLSETRKKEFEKKAEKHLRLVIAKAGLKPEKLTTIEILNQFKTRKLTNDDAQKILDGLKEFKKQFAKTRFAQDHPDVVETLKTTAEECLKRNLIIPDDKDKKAAESITNATSSALDLLLPDDE